MKAKKHLFTVYLMDGSRVEAEVEYTPRVSRNMHDNGYHMTLENASVITKTFTVEKQTVIIQMANVLMVTEDKNITFHF